MKPLAIWKFIAGDSRLAPLGILIAVAVVVSARRLGAEAWQLEALYAGLLALTLCAATFERT